MRQILAFTRKEILLWAQKPGSWIIVFLVPFLFIWIMYSVFGSSGTPVVTIFVVTEEDTPAARQVLEALRSAENLQVEKLETRERADRRVGAGELMAAVIVPEGFGDAVTSVNGAKIDIIIDPTRAEQASIVTGLVNKALVPIVVDAEVSRAVERGINRVMRDFNPDNQQPSSEGQIVNIESLEKFFGAAFKGIVSGQVQETIQNPQVKLDVQSLTEMSEDVRRPSLLDYLVPGYSLMFVFFLISNLAVTVVEERDTGTLRRLLIMPVARSSILLGKMLPYYLIAVLQFIIVLGVSKLAFGLDLGSSTLGLAIIILTSSLAMVSLGILVAAMARSEGQADGLAIVVVLAMAVVSGAMFPTISIPGLQAVTPHYWALQGFLNIISRGQGVEGAFLPAGILLTMSAVFFTIGAVRFHFE